MARLFHTFARLRAMDRQAWAVVHAVADNGPAVVVARFDNIKLIAALGAMLVGPHVSGDRVDVDALGIAMPVAKDFRQRTALTHEGVVAWHSAIVVQTNDGAVVISELLCGMRLQIT